nr:MAG TPA_asm: Receptor recognition protein, Long tail, Helical sandwich, Tail fiber [Caudoviricetes sp.]
MSSYAFENHSGADTYFGVGGGKLLVTDNNHWNGGKVGWRDIEFRNWKANSHEKYKKDIKEWHTSVLDVFKNELQLYQYKYKDNLENNMLHRGIVLREDSVNDKFPAEWRQDDGYNGNEVMWWNTKAIQELAHENDELKKRIEKLEELING